jgi:chemotaxis protein histidine kinase CheA
MNETREQKMAAARVRMAQLAERFIERTRGDLRTMRDDLAKVRAGDVTALAGIRHLAHRMAGTGATLGFDALGECAAGIEVAIDTLPPGTPPGTPPGVATVDRLAAGIDALEAQLAADARGYR